jgi:hypothetical protein
MRLHVDQNRPIATRYQPMERVENGGVSRHQVLPRAWALTGVLSANPDAVARAIDDLGGSGYRPLGPRPMAPDPASMGRAWDGGGDRDAGRPSPATKEES